MRSFSRRKIIRSSKHEIYILKVLCYYKIFIIYSRLYAKARIFAMDYFSKCNNDITLRMLIKTVK